MTTDSAIIVKSENPMIAEPQKRHQVSLREAKELSKKGLFKVTSSSGVEYDPLKEANPDCMGNTSRIKFLHSCYYSSIGIYFQNQIKLAIIRAIGAVHNKQRYEFSGDLLDLQITLYNSIKDRIQHDPDRKQPFMLEAADILVYYAYDNTKLQGINRNKLARESINLAHGWLSKYYDKEAYVYSDSRIESISTLLKSEIMSTRNDESILKIIDICCFLMKEDIYYRPRWIQILQDIKPTVDKIERPENQIITILKKLCALTESMPLTSDEIQNIERWH